MGEVRKESVVLVGLDPADPRDDWALLFTAPVPFILALHSYLIMPLTPCCHLYGEGRWASKATGPITTWCPCGQVYPRLEDVVLDHCIDFLLEAGLRTRYYPDVLTGLLRAEALSTLLRILTKDFLDYLDDLAETNLIGEALWTAKMKGLRSLAGKSFTVEPGVLAHETLMI